MESKSLGYDRFGKGHRSAIIDEDRFHTWLNSGGHKHFDWGGEIFDHAEVRGGTKKIEDVVAIMKSGREITFSNKLARSGIENHSHTWKNDSKIFTRLRKEGSIITQPFTNLIEFRDRQVEHIPNFRDRRPNRERYDTMMKAVHQKVRDNLTEKLIDEIFQVQLTHATKNVDWVVISDEKKEVYYWYRPYHHPVVAATAQKYQISYRKNRAKWPFIRVWLSLWLDRIPVLKRLSEWILMTFDFKEEEIVKLNQGITVGGYNLKKGTECKITSINDATVQLKPTEPGVCEPFSVNLSNHPAEIRKVKKTVGNESGNIYLIMESGEKLDFKLRMRVKHNDGVTAFFKMGGKAEKKGVNAGGGSFVSTINQDPGSLPMILDSIEEDGNLHGASFVLI